MFLRGLVRLSARPGTLAEYIDGIDRQIAQYLGAQEDRAMAGVDASRVHEFRDLWRLIKEAYRA